MKICAVVLLLLLTILFQCNSVQGGYQLEYVINVYRDGSATWIVEQRGTDVPASFASFDAFVKNVSLLVNLCKEKTQREMSIEDNPKMNVSFFGSYKVVTFEFLWNGFANVEDGQIIIGDVFLVENFFSYFYGDGAVSILYPSGYTIENVSPQPHEWKEPTQKLKWYGTENFKLGEPKVALNEKNAFSNFMDTISRNVILIASLVALIIIGSVSLYYFKFRKNVAKKTVKPQTHFPQTLGIMDDEEKVINLLKAAGGTLYQSTITEQCGFSRSKTSKLLKEMERKRIIKREEKGREKIVTFLEEEVRGEGEN